LKPKPIERFGPEWWTLYGAAWAELWPSARNGTREHTEKDGGWKITPVDRAACVLRTVRDADEGLDAFNGSLSKIGDPDGHVSKR
jgi:hypothetical protein